MNLESKKNTCAQTKIFNPGKFFLRNTVQNSVCVCVCACEGVDVCFGCGCVMCLSVCVCVCVHVCVRACVSACMCMHAHKRVCMQCFPPLYLCVVELNQASVGVQNVGGHINGQASFVGGQLKVHPHCANRHRVGRHDTPETVKTVKSTEGEKPTGKQNY